MPTTITDSTAGVQRLAVSNSAQTEIGHATPSSEFSVNGRAIMSGTNLAQATVSSSGMLRITGSILCHGLSGANPGANNPSMNPTVTITTRMAGFGAIVGDGYISGFSTDKKSFSVWTYDSANTTLQYSVF
jgi:hypothetical protein